MTIDKEEIKKLCWLSWRYSGIGPHQLSIELDKQDFLLWWEENAEFLLNNLPIPNKDLE